jgi:hypothetical protein
MEYLSLPKEDNHQQSNLSFYRSLKFPYLRVPKIQNDANI